ncbi:MAG TPA: DEAD/DEAH box helicase [Kofleriaceae bacterium]
MPFTSAHPSLLRALDARGYKEPTPVQAAILGADAANKDLLVSAQTGSGKTVAFGLALAQSLLGEAARFTPAGQPRALIVTPTRELALQVARELSWLFAETGVRLATCVGGMDPRREAHDLSRGVHIVVGTPGRLADHLARGALVLDKVSAVVLDEADEMLDMGFREDIEKLLETVPTERRTLLFSATIPREIAALAKKFQQGAVRLAVTAEGDRHHDIEYQAIPIVPRERDLAVVNLLRYHEAAGALVFCATRDGVAHLAANLSERGFAVAALSGDHSQRERNQALQALRDGRARVCVATDVAARGLDLPDLGLVIHADMPQNREVLVHRSGRTGRAGKRGVAVLLVPDPARRFAERMLAGARADAKWMRAPSAEDVAGRDQALLVSEIGGLAGEPSEADREVARTLLADRPAEDLVAALVGLRRDLRPSPEDLTIPMSMRPRAPMQARDAHRGDPRDLRRDARPHRDDARPHLGDARPHRDAPADARTHRDAPADARTHRDAPADARPHRDAPADARPHRDAPADARSHRDAPAPADARPFRESRPRPDPRAAGPSDAAPPGSVWFTVNVGRTKNADPRWLVPLLCRRGKIAKSDIGKIQILTRETRVQIAADVSDRFAAAAREPDTTDRNIQIEPVEPERA